MTSSYTAWSVRPIRAALVTSSVADESLWVRDRSVYCNNAGTNNAASIAMIAITIISSTNEKPLFLLFRLNMPFHSLLYGFPTFYIEKPRPPPTKKAIFRYFRGRDGHCFIKKKPVISLLLYTTIKKTRPRKIHSLEFIILI
jgi:hypothetical protein